MMTYIMLKVNRAISLFTSISFDLSDKNMGEQIVPPRAEHWHGWTDNCTVVFSLIRCEYLWCATYKIHGLFTAVLDPLKRLCGHSSHRTDMAASSPAVFHKSTAEYDKSQSRIIPTDMEA